MTWRKLRNNPKIKLIMQKNRPLIKLCFNIFLSFLALGLYAAEDHPVINYEILIQPDSADVKIKMSYFPKTDQLCFGYNPESIIDIKAQNKKQTNLKISKKGENIFCITNFTDDLFISFHSPVRPYIENLNKTKSLSNIFIEDSAVIHGSNLFIKPILREDKDNNPIINVTFSIKDLESFKSSLGTQMNYINLKELEKLDSSLFIAGKIKNEALKINKTNYSCSFVGDWNKSLIKKIKNLYRIIATKQYELLGFMPTNKMDVLFIKSSKIKRGHGFQYSNAIVYMLPEKTELKDLEFLKLLAHEHFHLWNGNYIKPANGLEEEMAWFKEGVTNYYALISLVSSKILSEKDFLEYISSKYIKYDSSHESDDLFVAMAIDLEIIKASGLKLNLDKLMVLLSTEKEILSNGYNDQNIKDEIVTLANWDVSSFFDK
ncbi:MAG: hypothetical protein WCQ47_06370, partial [bacterium]